MAEESRHRGSGASRRAADDAARGRRVVRGLRALGFVLLVVLAGGAIALGAAAVWLFCRVAGGC